MKLRCGKVRHAQQNERARQRHLRGVWNRRSTIDGPIRRANLTMTALGFCCAAFIAALVLAAVYLPLPRDMHLPAPAEQGVRK